MIKRIFRNKISIPPSFFPLIIVLGLNIILNPNILSLRGVSQLFVQITPIILAVMAQSIVLLVRELDLSIGSMVSFFNVVLISTMGYIGYGSIPLVLIIAVIIGAFTGFLVAYLKIPGIVITLTTSMIIGGAAILILPTPGGAVLKSFGNLINKNYLLVPNLLILLIIIFFAWNYIRKSRIGQSLYATGGNYYSAFASGINVKKTKILAYIGSAVMCAITAMVLSGKIMTGDSTIGDSYTLISISGAVLGGVSFLGGIGTMTGAVAGAIVISLLSNVLFFLNVGTYYQSIVQGAILLIAVLISLVKK